MSELSERELLLLSNFMYISASAQENMRVGEIVEELLANGIPEDSLSGGLTVDSATEILTEIQKNPELCDLKVEQALNTDGVRASCLVDDAGNATVVFRGTGGSYVAWKDNVLGEFQTDTACQQMAADFIKEECGDYANITVTGHSKGGNLAQYCTITCSDQIDRCVSYDGQGMNEEYFQKYVTEIAENRDKITCINCDGDYVNSLLFFLAKDVKFMLTEEGANPHAPWEFYCKNKDNVDEYGNYVNFVEQTDSMKLLNVLGDELVIILGLLPDTQEEGIVEVVSALIGLGFACVSGQLTWENVWDAYKTLIEASFKISHWEIVDIASYLQEIYDAILDYANGKNISWEKIQDSLEEYAALIGEINQCKIRHADFYVSCNGLQSSVQDMTNIEKKLDAIYSRLEAIELPGTLAFNVGLSQALKAIREEVIEEKEDVKECREILSACMKCYQEAERRCEEQSLEV